MRGGGLRAAIRGHGGNSPASGARGEPSPRIVVIGIGNAFRGDDGAGLAVVRAARSLLPATVEVIELDGEPARLVESWDGAAAAFVVDAVRSGSSAGSVHRYDATEERLPRWEPSGGSHSLGAAAAVDLARSLDRLPAHLIVYGVEGADFDNGVGLTPAVASAVPQAATRIAEEAGAVLHRLETRGGR
ncbi:MAG: hydrogenase maturation protease [Acidimicrobiia bacterium]|nr:hydrogenase maturation protease [Acidimicrobiia bacterium]